MAISPYDRAIFAQYTPLTQQEILMPAMLQRERHDKLDEQYAAINDDIAKIKFMSETEGDEELTRKYNQLQENLTHSMEELNEKGVNANSKANMFKAKSLYKQELEPYTVAYQIRQQQEQAIQQARITNPNLLIEGDKQSLTGIMKNGMVAQTPLVADLAQVTERGRQIFSDMSKKLATELSPDVLQELQTEIIHMADGTKKSVPAIYGILKERGVDLSKPENVEVLKNTIDQITNMVRDYSKFSEPNQQIIKQAASAGSSAALGVTDWNIQDNSSTVARIQQQQENIKLRQQIATANANRNRPQVEIGTEPIQGRIATNKPAINRDITTIPSNLLKFVDPAIADAGKGTMKPGDTNTQNLIVRTKNFMNDEYQKKDLLKALKLPETATLMQVVTSLLDVAGQTELARDKEGNITYDQHINRYLKNTNNEGVKKLFQ
jgi:hypothetical protein